MQKLVRRLEGRGQRCAAATRARGWHLQSRGGLRCSAIVGATFRLYNLEAIDTDAIFFLLDDVGLSSRLPSALTIVVAGGC